MSTPETPGTPQPPEEPTAAPPPPSTPSSTPPQSAVPPPPAAARPSTPTPAATVAAGSAAPGLPSDADDLRGTHFKALLGRKLTWFAIGIPAVVGGIVGASASPVIGIVVAAAIVAVGIGVVLAIADSQAADDFFHVYAQTHALELGGKTRLPAATPLLRKGDDRYATRTLTGEIAPRVGGLLALFTYEEQTTDSNGNQETNYYKYTLGMTEVPECLDHLPELYCQRKSGLRALEGFEDVFRRNKRRVKLESEALDKRYEIFVHKDQDDVWLHRLFSPSFIVWLSDSAPQKFAFEFVAGSLVAYVNGHKEDTADLDAVATATSAVAGRLREESAQSSPPAG
jgi:hypothetical protein